jgi:hypothetical protein
MVENPFVFAEPLTPFNINPSGFHARNTLINPKCSGVLNDQSSDGWVESVVRYLNQPPGLLESVNNALINRKQIRVGEFSLGKAR